MPRCMCVCSKFERGRECGFACGFVAGTLSVHTMHALDIPSAPVSVHKGLPSAFDMLESAAGLQRQPSRVYRTYVGGQHAESWLTSFVIFPFSCITYRMQPRRKQNGAETESVHYNCLSNKVILCTSDYPEITQDISPMSRADRIVSSFI